MTVSLLATQSGVPGSLPTNVYKGLSSDTKLTACESGSTFFETDTGNRYIYDGSTWRQQSTAGSTNTNQKGGVWDYGNWFSYNYMAQSVVITASASGTIVYTSADITAYNGFVFEVAAIGGTTPKLSLAITLDGTNYAATLPEIINLADNSVITGATGVGAIGLYALNMPASANVKYKGLKITQTGGAADQTCTIRYAHLWA